MALIKFRNQDYVPVHFNHFVDRFLNDVLDSKEETVAFAPASEILESDKKFELRLSLPGVDKKNISIDIDNDQLIIKGERNSIIPDGYKVLNSGLRYGNFAKKFFLPEDVNKDSIKAEYKDGILSIHIAKDETKIVKRSIEVK